MLVIDRNFNAYFYAILQARVDASKIAEAIVKTCADAIVKTEVVDRHFFGKPVTVIKISCRDATATGKAAKKLRSLEGVADCIEDGVRNAMR